MLTKSTRQKAVAEEAPRAFSLLSGDMDALLRSLQAFEASDDSPAARRLDKAQELIFDAWEAPTAARSLALAKKALAISPLCADALVIMSEAEPEGSDAELDYLRRAVAAGETAIGPKGFAEFDCHFWGFLQTRPYMRARETLALCLWRRGQLDETRAHMEAMLALNPEDNQGIRYSLMSLLQELRADAALSSLLARYPENTASWTYTAALASFRSGGDTRESTKALRAALKANRHVAPFLLGTAKMPKRLPDFVKMGDPAEAADYALANVAAWQATDGALAWLEAIAAAQARPPSSKAPARRGGRTPRGATIPPPR